MKNFEKHILRAIPKVYKEYLKQWSKVCHEGIYVELDSINIIYEIDDSWAEVVIQWGREDDSFPFYHQATVAIYPRHFKYLVGYILGVIEQVEYNSIK